jgi:signal transduction histidine kinase
LKFTETGQVKVNAIVSKNFVKFEVKDTGIGMKQEFIDNGLFLPFGQEEKPLLGIQRGVGLGNFCNNCSYQL